MGTIGNGRGSLILAVDIGTSLMKCILYDRSAKVKGRALCRVQTVSTSSGGAEINPDDLWLQFVGVVREALLDCQCKASDIRAMGICTQRCTFITWDKETGEPFHNFICWNDVRSSELCKQWNDSWTIQGLNFISKFMHSVTRSKRFLAGSIFKLKARMVAPRLLWAIENNVKLKERAQENKVFFGGIETWLLWRLTGGLKYCTEISLASTTGMFDPFLVDWGHTILRLITVPLQLLPPVNDTTSDFGYCLEEIFGARIPIAALSGDQQAGVFGCCCFDEGTVKLTMGTGLFIDMNTGSRVHASIHGIYPLIGWKIKQELNYLVESSANDAGSTLLWAQSVGLFDSFEETSALAESVKNTGGVYFVPAFSGLQAPVNNDYACAMFIGLKPETTKTHMVRAILESLAFRVYQIYDVMLRETANRPLCIKCVGGISKNGFVCQLIADLTQVPLEKMINEEVTAMGVAFMAGLATNFWTSKQELKRLVPTGQVYLPKSLFHRQTLMNDYSKWLQAIQRSVDWYKDQK